MFPKEGDTDMKEQGDLLLGTSGTKYPITHVTVTRNAWKDKMNARRAAVITQ